MKIPVTTNLCQRYLFGDKASAVTQLAATNNQVIYINPRFQIMVVGTPSVWCTLVGVGVTFPQHSCVKQNVVSSGYLGWLTSEYP